MTSRKELHTLCPPWCHQEFSHGPVDVRGTKTSHCQSRNNHKDHLIIKRTMLAWAWTSQVSTDKPFLSTISMSYFLVGILKKKMAGCSGCYQHTTSNITVHRDYCSHWRSVRQCMLTAHHSTPAVQESQSGDLRRSPWYSHGYFIICRGQCGGEKDECFHFS